MKVGLVCGINILYLGLTYWQQQAFATVFCILLPVVKLEF